jgi:hypothetical protein
MGETFPADPEGIAGNHCLRTERDGTLVPVSRYIPSMEGFMKPIAMLGVVLIVLGVAGLFFSRIGWTETKPVLKVGPLQVNSQEDHTIWIPTAAGLAAVLAGVGLVFAGRRGA